MDLKIKIWNIEEKKEEHEFKGHTSYIFCVAISYDQKFIFSGSADNSIKVWKLEEKREDYTLVKNIPFVLCIAVTKNGRKLITGSRDKTLAFETLTTDRKNAFYRLMLLMSGR